MEESIGESLGFRLLSGRWPVKGNEVIVEEYILDLFHKNVDTLPCDIELVKDGKKVTYQITGVISNYSSTLPTSSSSNLDTKVVYPSIIFNSDNIQQNKISLLVSQKKLNYKTVNNDLDLVIVNCEKDGVDLDIQNICFNNYLYVDGYLNN